MSLDLRALLNRVYYRYPSFLLDTVAEHEPGVRLVAMKNVTVGEEFFQGHFPGLAADARRADDRGADAGGRVADPRARRRAADRARVAARRQQREVPPQVVPGDQLRLEVTLVARPLTAGQGAGDRLRRRPGGDRGRAADRDPARRGVRRSDRARASRRADRRRARRSGRARSIGPDVTIGQRCRIGASVVIDGWTEIGDETQIFPMASIGLAPQDLKYKGERTRLTIGRRNIFREFVTINRGTLGGGGHTSIGNHNLFMAYVHVAHDCHVGNHTIFGPHATIGGHVGVEDFANISAGSAVHQFCRIGRHGFVGGYSVVTKDALPFGRTIGSRPARIFGVNTIGLSRRDFTPDTIEQLKRAYRYLLLSKLNTSRALAQIEHDPTLTSPEVRYLVDFIRSSQRGVILRRPMRRIQRRGTGRG